MTTLRYRGAVNMVTLSADGLLALHNPLIIIFEGIDLAKSLETKGICEIIDENEFVYNRDLFMSLRKVKLCGHLRVVDSFSCCLIWF